MARCAAVRCAHSVSFRADFGFACSVPSGALHFFAFSPFPVKNCLWKPVMERAVKPIASRPERLFPAEGRFFILRKVYHYEPAGSDSGNDQQH